MKIKILNYSDYRKFVRDVLETYPKKGHGQFRKIAQTLRTNTVTISQIFAGKRDLSLEQAVELAEFLALDSSETKCFLLLVQISRAGNSKLKEHLKSELAEIHKNLREVKKVLPTSKEISDEAKAIFYSDWSYSLVRLASSLPYIKNESDLAKYTGLPRARVAAILRFLIKLGLLVETSGRFRLGPASTHLDSQSPYIKSRQISWRTKSAEFMNPESGKENLFYTGPFAMGEEEYEWLREELLQLIKQFVSKASNSQANLVGCFNIDLFKMISKP
jgi:uncharacterized protein (TIGR02147 family)